MHAFCTKALAGDRGHSLFVGVDKYDLIMIMMTRMTTISHKGFKEICHIEKILNESFFAPLKEGCKILAGGHATIGKYFITGVYPVHCTGTSPLAEIINISDRQELHGICGFTEN